MPLPSPVHVKNDTALIRSIFSRSPKKPGDRRPQFFWFWTAVTILSLLLAPWTLQARPASKPLSLIGPNDALLVTDANGSIVYSANIQDKKVPASTLKILTSLVALHYLGREYRFITEFYLDRDQRLKIKGYGDPMLISEVWLNIAKKLSRDLDALNGIVTDGRFFSQPVLIPGRSATHQPYDAPNGALCANFNTIQFKKDRSGRFLSAESQTPLIPFALPRIKASGMSSGRITLSHRQSENELYAGHLIHYFLSKNGVNNSGNVTIGRVNPDIDRLLLRFRSPFSLIQVIKKLLQHSNNFIANQLLIAFGATIHGPPGTMEKGVSVMRQYAREVLGLKGVQIVEGSGLSRMNRLSAMDLDKVVDAFTPYRHLMAIKDRVVYKTGTLHGVSARAGWIRGSGNRWYRFVALMNTPGKSAEPVVRAL